MSPEGRRRPLIGAVVSVAALVAALVAAPTARSAEPPGNSTHPTVTEVVDGTACSHAGCSLRGLLERSGAAEIELPAARLTLGRREPLEVRGSVTLRGLGPDRSVIDGLGSTRIFRLHPGARLRLEGVSLLRGGGNAVEIGSGASVEMVEVYLSDGARPPAADPSVGAAYCATDGEVLTQYLAAAEVSDATALGLLPGRPF